MGRLRRTGTVLAACASLLLTLRSLENVEVALTVPVPLDTVVLEATSPTELSALLAFPEDNEAASTIHTSISGQAESSRRNRGDTAVVMFDTRRLDMDLNSSYIYHRWAAGLNYQYSLEHGYDFFYIHSEGVLHHDVPNEAISVKTDGRNSNFKRRTCCYLEMPGQNSTVPRGAPWCKLLGVAAIFERGYPNVVMIDSDAFFKLGAPNIETIIANNTVSLEKEPIVWLTQDAPLVPDKPNTGLQIWRTQQLAPAWNLLRQWWQLNVKPQAHAYEQSGMLELLKDKRNEECGVGLLRIKAMMQRHWDDKLLPVIHMIHSKKKLRESVMRPEFQKLEAAVQNGVLDRVLTMTANETFRLQRLLGKEIGDPIC